MALLNAGFPWVAFWAIRALKHRLESAAGIRLKPKNQTENPAKGSNTSQTGPILRDLVPKNCCEITLQGQSHENKVELFIHTV